MDGLLVLAIAIVIFLLWKNSQLLNATLQQEQSNSDGQVYVYDDSYPYYGSWWGGYPYWSWWGGGYPYRWRRPWRRHGGWHRGRHWGGRGFRRGGFRRGGGRRGRR